MTPRIHSEVDRDHSPGSKRRTTKPVTVTWRAGGRLLRVTVPEGFAYKPTGFAALRVLTLGLIRRYEAEDFSCLHDALYYKEAWKKREDGRKSNMAERIKVERRLIIPGLSADWVTYRPTQQEADRVAYATDTDRRWVQHVLYYATRAFGGFWW